MECEAPGTTRVGRLTWRSPSESERRMKRMASRDIGIGFIGAGDVSILHAEAIRRCPGARLVGLWNRTPERAAKQARRFGCAAYESPEALVSSPEIDAVFVLTNLETHREFSLLALEAGKNVLVEKPVASSVEEIREIQQTASQKGLVCMPGHNYIYEQGVVRTQRLIERGDLGRLISIYVLYNIHHPEEVAARYPGVVRQILTHHSYILLFLGGRPRRLSALKACLHYERITQEDIAIVNLEMENGALAHLCASFAADDHSSDPWTVVIKVLGTEGSTRYSYRDWVEVKPGLAHSQTYTAYQGSIENEVRHFVERCLGAGEQPLSTLEDAIAAQQIVEACEQSIQEERTVSL